MRIRWMAVTAGLAAIMRAVAGQDQPAGDRIDVWTVEAGHPVAHLVLGDLDGDGLNDALLVTRTRPSLCVVAKRIAAHQGFAAPLALDLGAGCDGLLLQPAPNRPNLLVMRDGATIAKTIADFAPLEPRRLPEGRAPPFLGFAADFDGDGTGDPLLPVGDGFRLTLSKDGAVVPVRPPLTRERTAGVRGLLSERSRFPLVSFETLAPGDPPRPFFFADGGLRALRGSLANGFGPDADVVLQVPAPGQEASLERTEARLVDVDDDDRRELLVVRTRTQPSALANVRTELIFHRTGGAEPGRPAQAILLPGILSSGPDVRDVDLDGRLDLFLAVFGENLSQQVARRITGRVRVEYLLYRGSSEGQPFHRAPDFTESDHVPESEFVEWELRHRLLLGDDWSGDGRPDLLRVGAHDRGTRLEVLPGRTGGGKAGFADSPSAVAETPLGVKNRQCWRLSPDEPAVICRTETGAVIFAGR